MQHPFGHDDGVQTHCPAVLHVRPLLPAVQSLQAAPPVPHDGPDCPAYFSHVPAIVQQPPGHVFASHEQVPLVVSHRLFAHGPHVAPAVPHEAPVCEPHGWQVPIGPPLQQPLGHDVASQMHVPFALLHSSPVAHGAQVAPAVPHEGVDSPTHGSHVPVGPPLQHPWGHDVASQTQVPLVLSHSVPVEQAAHATPPVPHEFCDSMA